MNKKIMVVDDSYMTVKELQFILRAQNDYEIVSHYATGEDALKHIGEDCSISQADAKQSDSRIAVYSRQEKQYNSCQGHSLSNPDQLPSC